MDIELEERIGEGLTGTVWRGRETSLDRAVAVKVLHSEDGQISDVHRRHVDAIKNIHHPNVVVVYGIESVQVPGLESSRIGIVMEFLAGENLEDWLATTGKSLDEAKNICLGMIEGVRAIHLSGHVHGDLHTRNIRICDRVPKIIDPIVRNISAPYTTMAKQEAKSVDLRWLRQLICRVLARDDIFTSRFGQIAFVATGEMSLDDLRLWVEATCDGNPSPSRRAVSDRFTAAAAATLADDRRYAVLSELERNTRTATIARVAEWIEQHRDKKMSWDDWEGIATDCLVECNDLAQLHVILARHESRLYGQYSSRLLDLVTGSRPKEVQRPLAGMLENVTCWLLHLSGGSLITSGDHIAAWKLVSQEVFVHEEYRPDVLWHHRGISTYLDGMEGNCLRTWRFLRNAWGRIPNANAIAPTQQEYEVLVGSWNALITAVDMSRTDKSVVDEVLTKGASSLHRTQPAMFASLDMRALWRIRKSLFPSAEVLNAFADRFGVDAKWFVSAWPKWVGQSAGELTRWRVSRDFEEALAFPTRW